MIDPDYMLDFEAFQNNFRKTEVSGEEVGELVMRMAGYYARYNIRLSEAIRNFSRVKSNFQSQIDPSNSKPMSTSKAEILADATDEAAAYEIARIHVNNIQEMINALKSLQKGILVEYSNS
jgi:hypothetical protein